MPTLGDLLSTYTANSELSNLLESDKFGIYAADTYLALDGVTDDYAALYALINTTINGADAEIWFKNGTCLIGTSITIPSNVTLVFLSGGMLKPESGITITSASAKIEAGLTQIFDLSDGGTLAGTWSIDEVYLEWFGETGSSDDSTLFTNAISMLPTTGGKIKLLPKTYNLTAGFSSTKKGVFFEGCGGGTFNESAPYIGTTILCSGTNTTFIDFDSGTSLSHIGPRFEKINFIAASTTATTLVRIKMMNRWTVRDCSFRGAAYGLYIDASEESGGDASWGIVDNGIFKGCTYGIYSPDLTTGNQASFLVIGGDYECTTNIYLGNRQPQTRIQGVKMDGGIGVYSKGYANIVMGNTFEGCNPAIKIENDAAGHPNSGDEHMLIGNNITGRTGAETGISIGSSCGQNIAIANRFSNLSTLISDSGTETIQIDANAFKWLVTNGKIELASTHYFDQRVNIQGVAPVYAGVKNTTATTGREWRLRSENDGNFLFYNQTNTLGKIWMTYEGGVILGELASEHSAPYANSAVLFTKDDGAGKTQLCVRFATGATQVISTEP